MSTLRFRFLAFAALGVATLGGCRGCDPSKPYVPYHVGGGDGGAAALDGASGTSSASGSAQPAAASSATLGIAAPLGATTWSIGGMTLTAPAGRVFLAGIALARAANEPPAVAAFVGDGGSMAGEVVLYRGTPDGHAAGAVTLARTPPWLVGGPGCNHVVALAQPSPSTLWVDVDLPCAPDPKRPSRWLVLLNAASPAPPRLELRAIAAPTGDRVSFTPASDDIDRDGVPDLSIALSLEGPHGERAVVPLRFLDRPAGFSREGSEPKAAFRLAATDAVRAAQAKGTAADARTRALYLRKLHTYACAEATSPGVFVGDDSPIVCGAVEALDDLRYAEARAALTLDEYAHAAGLASRLAQESPRSPQGAELFRQISRGHDVNASARILDVAPAPWSISLPIAFEPSGALLVRSTTGVVRIDPQTFAAAPAPDAPVWPLQAALLGDLRVDRVTDDCRTGPLLLHIPSASLGERLDPIPVLGGSTPRCSRGLAVPGALLDRGPDGVVVLVQGEPIVVSADGEHTSASPWPRTPGARGTIRSPDGNWSAMAGPDRVLLLGPGKPQVWAPKPSYSTIACTVADGGRAVACMLEKGVIYLTPLEPRLPLGLAKRQHADYSNPTSFRE